MKSFTDTSSFKSNDALAQLIRSSALYVLVLQMEDENLIDTCLTEILKSLSESKPALTKLGVGIPVSVCNAYAQQLKKWLNGSIDWDIESHEVRFQNSVTNFFLYLQEVIFDTDLADLNKYQREVRESFDPDELVFMKAILGYVLNLGRKYQSVRVIDGIVKTTKILFPDVKTLIYQQESQDSPYYDSAPDDYQSKINILKGILERNKIETVADDLYGGLLATYAGLEKLKSGSEADYKVYQDTHRYLNTETFKAIISDIVNDCEGEGQPWAALYRRIHTYQSLFISPAHYPNGSWTGIVEIIKTDRGEYGIVYRSPFGEPLKQVPVGNIEMNPSYTKGSTNFVARYVLPNSRGLTKNYIYTLAAVKSKNQDRFSETRAILMSLDANRDKWIKDVRALAIALDSYAKKVDSAKTQKAKDAIKPPSAVQWRKGMLAMICEIGYQAAPRTGERGTSSIDKGSNSRVPTYALTTLNLSHLVITPEEYNPLNWSQNSGKMTLTDALNIKSIAFKYRGKAAEPQFHMFSDVATDGDSTSRRLIMRILRDYIAQLSDAYSKEGMDLATIKKQHIFKIPIVRGATLAPISAWTDILNRNVNGYLKSLGFPSTFTFKMFRKLKATKEFMEYMDSVKSQLTADNIDQHVLHGAALAGKALGHAAAKQRATGTMAMQYYIVSAIVLDYYQAISATPGKRVANLIKDNINDAKS